MSLRWPEAKYCVSILYHQKSLPSLATIKAPIPDADKAESDLPQDQPEQPEAAAAKQVVYQEVLDYSFLHRYQYNHFCQPQKKDTIAYYKIDCQDCLRVELENIQILWSVSILVSTVLPKIYGTIFAQNFQV